MNMRPQNQYIIREPKKETNLLPYIAAVMIIVLVGFLGYRIFMRSGPVCGDSFCENGERSSCPRDCTGVETTVHAETICGDDICEGTEKYKCCNDCGCSVKGQFCDSDTRACKFPEADITDSLVETEVRRYFAAQGKNVLGVEAGKSVVYHNMAGKSAFADIQGEGKTYVIYIESGEVVVFPRA